MQNNDPVENTERTFGSAQAYVPAVLVFRGRKVAVLLTQAAVEVGMARAAANPEDAPDIRPWWKKLLA